MTDYVATAGEQALFRNAYARRTPLLLLGPPGCGKTLLVEQMAAALGRPLVTVTCHDDLTTADLVGRHLITGGDVRWEDGPLTRAMRTGAVCYLDEIVEARPDTLAMLHSVADHRRTLFVDRLGETVAAPPEFMLVASHNPRRPGSPKELKPALRQRFATIRLAYLEPAAEAAVIAAATGADAGVAERLAAAGALLRDTAERDPQHRFDPPSTRTLIAAAGLIAAGTSMREATEACLVGPLTADEGTAAALRELLEAQRAPL
jgi:nitric oxide reductase NorQ protein